MFQSKQPRLHVDMQTLRKHSPRVKRSTFRKDCKVVHKNQGTIT